MPFLLHKSSLYGSIQLEHNLNNENIKPKKDLSTQKRAEHKTTSNRKESINANPI